MALVKISTLKIFHCAGRLCLLLLRFTIVLFLAQAPRLDSRSRTPIMENRPNQSPLGCCIGRPLSPWALRALPWWDRRTGSPAAAVFAAAGVVRVAIAKPGRARLDEKGPECR